MQRSSTAAVLCQRNGRTTGIAPWDGDQDGPEHDTPGRLGVYGASSRRPPEPETADGKGPLPAAERLAPTPVRAASAAVMCRRCPSAVALLVGEGHRRVVALRPTAPDTFAAEEPVLILLRGAAIEVEADRIAALLTGGAGDEEFGIEGIAIAVGFIQTDVVAFAARITPASVAGCTRHGPALGRLAAKATADKGRRTAIRRWHAGAVLADRVEWTRRITVPPTTGHTGAVVAADLAVRAGATTAVAAVVATLLAGTTGRAAPGAADVGLSTPAAGLPVRTGAGEAEPATAIVRPTSGAGAVGLARPHPPGALPVLTGLVSLTGTEAQPAMQRVAGQVLAATAVPAAEGLVGIAATALALPFLFRRGLRGMPQARGQQPPEERE